MARVGHPRHVLMSELAGGYLEKNCDGWRSGAVSSILDAVLETAVSELRHWGLQITLFLSSVLPSAKMVGDRSFVVTLHVPTCVVAESHFQSIKSERPAAIVARRLPRIQATRTETNPRIGQATAVRPNTLSPTPHLILAHQDQETVKPTKKSRSSEASRSPPW